MGLSVWQILLVVLLAILLFGRGRISDLMGDVAKGIKSFKKGLSDEDEEKAANKEDPKKLQQNSEIADRNKTPENNNS
ncbi:twin-arginine translocase TatA/TatE family subunit [Luteithermobacter gelatinilyticus]|uniref:twin-arginine translocase TatA/TatE family subunit n=1 Tax=Luteithermobacter gelatinilyticus TaxID=2582913 RepID=UPI001105F60B|nr:twin-arginine translocase TatA/TatE family subunit [Luteithermobacter gelatinilyticus]|tara:strand:+ start:3402 stop:3635 length:234 start_codon:yes stop_codon:yes gene_type:complete